MAVLSFSLLFAAQHFWLKFAPSIALHGRQKLATVMLSLQLSEGAKEQCPYLFCWFAFSCCVLGCLASLPCSVHRM